MACHITKNYRYRPWKQSNAQLSIACLTIILFSLQLPPPTIAQDAAPPTAAPSYLTTDPSATTQTPYATVPVRANVTFKIPPLPVLPTNLSSIPGLNIPVNNDATKEFDKHMPFTSGSAVTAWNKMVASLQQPIDYGKLLADFPNGTDGTTSSEGSGKSIDIKKLLQDGAGQVGALVGVFVLGLLVSVGTLVYVIIRLCCLRKDTAKFDRTGRTMFRLICSVVLLASAVVAFSLAIVIDVSANDAVKSMSNFPKVVDGVLGGIAWYMSATFSQISDTVTMALDEPVEHTGAFNLISSDLRNIGPLLGGPLQTAMNTATDSKMAKVTGAMTDVFDSLAKAQALQTAYADLKTTLVEVNSKLGYVGTPTPSPTPGRFVDGVKQFCAGTCSKCTVYCSPMHLTDTPIQDLVTLPDTAATAPPDLDQFVTSLQDIEKVAGPNLKKLSSLSTFIHDATATQVQSALVEMASVQADVGNTIADARGSALVQITNMLDQVREGLASGAESVSKNSDKIGYAGAILMILCLVTPIVGTVAVIAGYLFFQSHISPDKRRGLQHVSGRALAGIKWINIVCTCLLCWLFAALFLILSLISVMLCSLLSDQDGNFTQLGNVEGKIVHLTKLNIPLNLQKTLIGCKYNEPLLQVVDLKKLNIDALNKDIIKSKLAAFNSDSLQQKISSSVDFSSLKFFADVKPKLNAAITQAGKTDSAATLPASVASAPSATAEWTRFYTAFMNRQPGDASVPAALTATAAEIDELQTTFKTRKVALVTANTVLSGTKDKLNAALDAVKNNGQAIDDYLSTNAKSDVITTVAAYIGRFKVVLDNLSDHLIYQIFDNVGRCRPLYDILMTLVDLLCGGMLGPLIGLLGAILVVFLFYIPMWITADRLAYYYRRHKLVTY